MSTADMQKPNLNVDNYSIGSFSILNTPIVELVGMFVLFTTGFLNLANVMVDKDDVGLDMQVMAKLGFTALSGLYGGWGLLSLTRVRKLLLSFPMLWIVMIIGCYFLAAPGSITPKESLASAIAMVCVTLMTVTALVHLGPMRVLITMFYSLGFFVFISWGAYFFMPEVGVFLEPTEGGEFIARMGGVSHPNTLGQFTGLTIVLGSILYIKYGQRSMIRVGIILMSIAALIGSLSRTSTVATLAALGIAFRINFFQRKYLLPIIVLGFAGSIALIGLVVTKPGFENRLQDKLSFLSKSGDTSELTSATGRAEIWSFAIRKLAERPITGYGAATTKYYLSDYSSYTHNLILNVAFSTGIIGGLLAIMMYLSQVRAIRLRHDHLANGLVAFVMINGLFENVIFSFLCGLPTMIWIVGICLPMMADETPDEDELNNGSLVDVAS